MGAAQRDPESQPSLLTCHSQFGYGICNICDPDITLVREGVWLEFITSLGQALCETSRL